VAAGADTLAVIATHLRPSKGFGGVAESTSELIRTWAAAGKRLAVVVSDGSRESRAPTPAEFHKALGAPTEVYRARVAVRWGFGWGAPGAILRAVHGAQHVYVSGIATWPTTLGALIASLLRRPHTIAVRGGLMAEHWAAIRRTRPAKAAFYRLMVFPTLRRATAVHAASELEAAGVRALAPGVRVIVEPNAFAAPPLAPGDLTPPKGEGLQLLYLGRLSPEKGVLGFARFFAAARGQGDTLTIAGPAVGDYGREVVELCRTPGLAFVGELPREALAARFRAAHALVLPSGVDGDVRENFGNVVVEALLHGRLALVTRGLAWDELEAGRVGVLFDRSLQDGSGALQRLRELARERGVYRRCRQFAEARYSVDVVAANLWRAMFEGA